MYNREKESACWCVNVFVRLNERVRESVYVYMNMTASGMDLREVFCINERFRI